jgi:hypothetical protein
LEGAVTIIAGLFVIFTLPDMPENWKALSPEMKSVAMKRMAIDSAEADAGDSEHIGVLQGMKLAFIDPKTYICAGIHHGTSSTCPNFVVRYS